MHVLPFTMKHLLTESTAPPVAQKLFFSYSALATLL